MVFRIVFFVALSSDLVILFINCGPDLGLLKYLTIWGLILTQITFMVGSVMHIWGDPKSDSSFSAWKWFVVLYEICFSIEVVITVGFWVALWKPMKDLPKYEPFL